MSGRPSVGVFTTDTSLVVQSWDSWMAQATGLPEIAACGQPLAALFPELATRGLLGRLRRVAEGAGVEVLAPAFHKHLIPCPPREPTSRLEHMRQHVTIAPMRDRATIVGIVVTIEDVTAAFEQERKLAADLDSQDEATRLLAAETLAAGGESPLLLAGSLTDESWRVRRAAAEGLAGGGGPEVAAMLIRALREHHRDPSLLNGALTALARTRDDVAAAVVALLDEPDAEVRTYAALALGLIGDQRASAALMRLLNDSDANVRFHAIEALGRLRDSEATEALMAIAETRDFFLAFAALDALAAIGDASVVPRLVPLLGEPMLRAAAASCLGALGDESVVPPLSRLLEDEAAPFGQIGVALAEIHDRLEAQSALGGPVADAARAALTEASAVNIVRALQTASAEEARGLALVLSWLRTDKTTVELASLLARTETRIVVSRSLVERGEPAIPAVIAVGVNGSVETRRACAEVLGRIGSTEATPALVSWLSDAPEVVIAAATALGAIGDRDAFEPLLASLDHEEASVRQSVVAALDSIGHPRMEEAVAGRLSDPSARVRESAARIAGYFGYGACLRRMVELCDDEEPIVRRAAVEHLASYDQRAAGSKIREVLRGDLDGSVRSAAARALGHNGSAEALTALLEASHDSNLWVRYFAIRSLGRNGAPNAMAIACLAECAMRDDAPPVRIAAIESLTALGSPSVQPVLLGLARDPDIDIACAAITAIGAFEPGGSESMLRLALESHEPRVLRATFATLARHRAGHAVPRIAEIARDSRDDELRRDAVRTLGAIGGRAAISELLALSADRHLRGTVISALAALDPEDTASLRAAQMDSDERRRRAVAEALSRRRAAPSTGRQAPALST